MTNTPFPPTFLQRADLDWSERIENRSTSAKRILKKGESPAGKRFCPPDSGGQKRLPVGADDSSNKGGSMKIVRGNRGGADGKRRDARSFDGNRAVEMLQPAFNEEKWFAHDDQTELL